MKIKMTLIWLFVVSLIGSLWQNPALSEEIPGNFDDIVNTSRPIKWDWQNPKWFPFELTGIWGSDPTNVWAVGAGGSQFFHFDGKSWKSVPIECKKCGDTDEYNNSCVFLKIHGTSADNIWAIGNHAIMHFDGSQWTQEYLKPTGECSQRYWFRDVVSFDDGSVFIAGHYFNGQDNSRAMAFVKKQSKWYFNRLGGSEDDEKFRSKFDHIWGSSADNVIAVGDQFVPGPHGHRSNLLIKSIKISGNDVAFDELASAPNLVEANIWGSSAQDIWAIGRKRLDLFDYRFSIQHFDGNSWTEKPLYIPGGQFYASVEDKINSIQKIQGSSASDIWAVGGSMFNTLYYDGSQWSEESGGIANFYLRSAWSSSKNFGFAVGSKAGPAGGRGVVIPLKANNKIVP